MKIYAVKIMDISEKKLEALCLLISSKKKRKIEKFVNKNDKIRTLIGEMLIRSIIVQELGIRNKHIIFEENHYGKPYLKGYPIINFNISHSGYFVVCAIDEQPIGVDIEEVKPIEYEDIAKKIFTIHEFMYITKQNSDLQLSKFYEIWTLKESYIKCCGQGLSTSLKSFSIDIDQNETINVIINNEHNEYACKKLEIESGYKMAVCSVNKEISDNVEMIDQNSLINNYSKFDLEEELYL